MKCINPIRIKNTSDKTKDSYPFLDCACGKCAPCLINRRRQWLFRLEHERLFWKNCYFITLTIDDSYCDGSLHKKDLQDFIKRFRHHIGLKYYAIGEYGTSTFRPHYHLLIFTNDVISDTTVIPWKYGYVTCSEVTPARLNYVTHYHVRPKMPKKLRNKGYERSFKLCSRGIGLSFLFAYDEEHGFLPKSRFFDYIVKGGRVLSDWNGNKFILPRYYAKKIEELGYDLITPVFDNEFSPAQRLFLEQFPDAVFSTENGLPLNYPKDLFFNHLQSVYSASLATLKKYHHQEKL